MVYDVSGTRRYRNSLEILKRSVAHWQNTGLDHAVLLGDLIDKTALEVNELTLTRTP